MPPRRPRTASASARAAASPYGASPMRTVQVQEADTGYGDVVIKGESAVVMTRQQIAESRQRVAKGTDMFAEHSLNICEQADIAKAKIKTAKAKLVEAERKLDIIKRAKDAEDVPGQEVDTSVKQSQYDAVKVEHDELVQIHQELIAARKVTEVNLIRLLNTFTREETEVEKDVKSGVFQSVVTSKHTTEMVPAIPKDADAIKEARDSWAGAAK